MNQLPPGIPNPAGPNIPMIQESHAQRDNRESATIFEGAIAENELLAQAMKPNLLLQDGTSVFVCPKSFFCLGGSFDPSEQDKSKIGIFVYFPGKGGVVIETVAGYSDGSSSMGQPVNVVTDRILEKLLVDNKEDVANLGSRLQCLLRNDKVGNTFLTAGEQPSRIAEDNAELNLGMRLASIAYKIPWGPHINTYAKFIKGVAQAEKQKKHIVQKEEYNFD